MIRTLGVAVSCVCVAAAAQVETLDAVCGLEDGQWYAFAYHKLVKHDGQVVRDAKGEVALMLGSEEDGSLTLTTRLDVGDTPIEPEQLAKIGLEPEDLRSEVVFLLDDTLTITGIRDWEGVRDRSVEVTDKIIGAMVRAGVLDEAGAEKMGAASDAAYSSEQMVVWLYSNRVAPYLFGYGWQLEAGTPIEQDISLANPLGGDELPGYSTAELKDKPSTEGVVEYVYKQHLNPIKANAVMRASLTALGMSDAQIRRELSEFFVDDYFVWSFDVEREIITKAELIRSSKMPGKAYLAEEHHRWELITGGEGRENEPAGAEE